MAERIYGINTLEFLNATIEEIYHRKKHYSTGKDTATLKGFFSAEFVRLERMFQAVYFCDVSLCIEEIDEDLFSRQFPFVYQYFHDKSYWLEVGPEQKELVDGITFYTSILEELRNINVHAIISSRLNKTFAIDEYFFDVFPQISDKVYYQKNGQMTIAGMFIMLFPMLQEEDLAIAVRNFVNIWGEAIWEVKKPYERKEIGEKLVEQFVRAFQTNYETPIQAGRAKEDIFENLFGPLKKELVLEEQGDAIRFSLDISKRARYYRWFMSGEIVCGQEKMRITIDKGSNVGIYFPEDYVLVVTDLPRFQEYLRNAAPLMGIAYLYHTGVGEFTGETAIPMELYKKLNYPQFYRDKDLNVLCYGNKNADIREINKSIAEGLMRMFLNFEERMVFTLNVNVYTGFSKIGTVLEALGAPKNLTEKIQLIRNFSAHSGMLNNYRFFKNRSEKITVEYVLDSIYEFIAWLNENGGEEHASYLHEHFHRHVLNNIVGVKYKRLIDNSAKLIRWREDKILELYQNLQKAFLQLDNSVISGADEEKIIAYARGYFSIRTKEIGLMNVSEGFYLFQRVERLIFKGKGIEVCGVAVPDECAQLLRTKEFKMQNVTVNGEVVDWKIVERYSVGLQDVVVYAYEEG